MDFAEFLTPVDYDLRNTVYSNFSVYNRVRFHLDEEVNSNAVIIIAINDLQEDYWDENEDNNFTSLRDHLYRLSISNWKRPIYDLGTIYKGSTFQDSCFALHQVISELSKTDATIIVLGGSQGFTFTIYKALKKDLLRVGTIDIKLDLDASAEELNANNHITKMILDETHRLLEYKNIGSQAPYIAKEELDILEQLNFEDLRLGKVVDDIKLAEPILRDIDLLSIDMNVMQHTSFKNAAIPTPNGFDEREICGLMKYAGLSNKIKMVHISNFHTKSTLGNALIAEMLWYYIEAKNNMKSDENKSIYRVQSSEGEIVFIHSKNSERWWLQIEVDGQTTEIPCNESDYLDALNGDIPNKWLDFYKKFY